MKEKTFSSKEEIFNEFKENCQGYEELSKSVDRDFSKFESFKTFFKCYYSEKNMGKGKKRSAVSERYFMLFLFDLLKEKAKSIKHHEPILIALNGTESDKIVDFKLGIDNKEFLIDLKMNIDLVEKDLFKGYLFKQQEKSLGENQKYFLVIFERNNGSKNKKEKDGQPLQLLGYGKKEKLIADYFYFPCWGKGDKGDVELEEKFNEEKKRLVDSFQ